ncbi:MAG: hypothetical protein JWP87_4610 [Labilithrix sp.]|nr:hypothetical protein [Labilithrix sp.]
MLTRTVVFATIGSAVVCAWSSVLAGCGGGPEHPAPSGDVSSASTEQTNPDYDAEEAAAARIRQNSCKPASARACRYYYKDSSGQWSCPMRTQFCRADGTSWLPCAAPYDGE